MKEKEKNRFLINLKKSIYIKSMITRTKLNDIEIYVCIYLLCNMAKQV